MNLEEAEAVLGTALKAVIVTYDAAVMACLQSDEELVDGVNATACRDVAYVATLAAYRVAHDAARYAAKELAMTDAKAKAAKEKP